MSEDRRRQALFVSNQGGSPVVEIKARLANAVGRIAPDLACRIAVLTAQEAVEARQFFPAAEVTSFEEHRRNSGDYRLDEEVARVVRDYPDENWAAVVMAERSFVDASNLSGGAGERRVTKAYVERLLVEFIRFFEAVITVRTEVVVAQTPDSLMTAVLYRVARRRGVPVRGLCPAWVTPDGRPGGFLTEDECLHAPAMVRSDLARRGRELTPDEIARADAFREQATRFDANAVYKAVTGVSFGKTAWSPNLARIASYLRDNGRRRPEIEYFMVDPVAKAKANVRRVWRRLASQGMFGPATADIPARSVFLPLHFQPEASTLVGGLFYANQIALAETVLKSLPLGWTLVVKEHPAGRGTRPVQHYRHLAHFPNVIFRDAPSKAIIPHVDAVITVTGTVGFEAIAMDKPVVMLGRWFWDHCPLIYRIGAPEELPALLHRILVDGDYAARPDRQDQIRRFLLSYLDALIPASPRLEGIEIYAKALVAELAQIRAQSPRAAE